MKSLARVWYKVPSLNGSSSADLIRLWHSGKHGLDGCANRLSSTSNFNDIQERFSQWIAGWCYCQLSILHRCVICLDSPSAQAEGETDIVDHTSTFRTSAKTRQTRSSAVYPTAVAKLYPRNLRCRLLRYSGPTLVPCSWLQHRNESRHLSLCNQLLLRCRMC